MVNNLNITNGNRSIQNYGTYNEGFSTQPKSTASADSEFQKLLKLLDELYSSSSSTTTKQKVLAKAIERDPKLKRKLINAAKTASLAGFEKMIEHPMGAVVVGAIKGWQQAEDK